MRIFESLGSMDSSVCSLPSLTSFPLYSLHSPSFLLLTLRLLSFPSLPSLPSFPSCPFCPSFPSFLPFLSFFPFVPFILLSSLAFFFVFCSMQISCLFLFMPASSLTTIIISPTWSLQQTSNMSRSSLQRVMRQLTLLWRRVLRRFWKTLPRRVLRIFCCKLYTEKVGGGPLESLVMKFFPEFSPTLLCRVVGLSGWSVCWFFCSECSSKTSSWTLPELPPSKTENFAQNFALQKPFAKNWIDYTMTSHDIFLV